MSANQLSLTDDQTPDDLTDDQLVAIVVQIGTYTRAASEFGWLRDKFTRYLSSRGLKGRCDDDLEAARNAASRAKVEEAAEAEEERQSELGDEVTIEEKLTQRVKELERQIREERKEKVFDVRVVEALESAVGAVQPSYVPPDPISAGEMSEHEFGLMFSDTHASEIVDPEEVLGLNDYNWDVMLDRMQKIQRSVISYQAHRPYPVRKLHIFELGDMLSGDIHDELAETNDRPVEEAVIAFAEDQAAWIEGFVPYFEEIEVHAVPGNHPRRHRKPRAKQGARNNSDWTSYHVARIKLQDYEQITWNISDGLMAVAEVCGGWRCLLMHGDGIRSTMPGVPWGGVTRRETALGQQFAYADQPYDFLLMGHFHTSNMLEGVGTRTFMNSSVKGVDEYSLKQFGSGKPPGQLLLTFHPTNGVTDVSLINLAPVGPAWMRSRQEIQR